MVRFRSEMLFVSLADVSIASNRLNQRPCHESDAVADCRLTDPIEVSHPCEMLERTNLWDQAHRKSAVIYTTR